MQVLIDFFRSGPDWLYTILLGAVLGGIAWYVHRRTTPDATAGSPIIDLLEGAIAGAVATAVIRPGDMLGVISTALVAGYTASAYLTKQAEALVSKVKDDATTTILQTADSVKQSKNAQSHVALLGAIQSSAQDKAAATLMSSGASDQEINELVTGFLQQIGQARSASEVRMLQHRATLELKKKINPAA